MLSIRFTILFTVVLYADCKSLCSTKRLAKEYKKCISSSLEEVGTQLNLGIIMSVPIRKYHYMCGNIHEFDQCLETVSIGICAMSEEQSKSSMQEEARNLKWVCNRGFGELAMALPCLSKSHTKEKLKECDIAVIGNCSALKSMVQCKIQVAGQCNYHAEDFTSGFWDIKMGPKKRSLQCPEPPTQRTSKVSIRRTACSAAIFSTSLFFKVFMVTGGYLLQRQLDWSKIWS